MKRQAALLLVLGVIVSMSSCGMRPGGAEGRDDAAALAAVQRERMEQPAEGDLRASLTPGISPEPTASAAATPGPTPAELSPTIVPAAKPTPEPTAVPDPAPAAASAPPAIPATSPAPTPAHTHVWVEVTEIVHHEAVTEEIKVVDQPATEGHYEGGSYPVVVCRCGAEFTTAEAYYAHAEELGQGHGGFTESWRNDQVWVEGTPEVSHYETRVVRDAWDEEVITGYVCASCGAVE